MHDYLYRACEEIDAALFSGDAIDHKASREELKSYIARWQRVLDNYKESTEHENQR